jgi:hypothetical protein
MARRVFFSFHHQADIWRVSQVRNSWLLKKGETNKFMDAASWESVKRKGDAAVKSWIDRQLDGTGVTVVLIGTNTADRRYVRYEIAESHRRGNGLLGIYIHGIKDANGKGSKQGRNPLDDVTVETEGLFFELLGVKVTKRLSEIFQTYYWNRDDGRNNMATWIEDAAARAGR